MKRIYTLNLAALSLLVLLFSCQKDPVLPDGMKLPTLTINKISELPFSNTEWNHVFGGMAEVTYIKGSSSITDSLDLAKLSGYQKTLELGTYDVQLRTKSIATADTFIRFAAELKGLVVDKGQAISLTGSTKDGLITIKKESVKDNTVPTFTPATAGSKTYKMGLIDGYYFLYVTAGTSGQLSFYSKATEDRITKNLSIAAVNHYNLVLVTNGTSSIRVELQKFVYNEVQVSSSTLITIETPLNSLSPVYEYTFVIADEGGKILNSVKYELGTTLTKLASKEPYLKDRLSVFLLARPLRSDLAPHITAYMNVKRGSVWPIGYQSLRTKSYSNSPMPVSLLNVPAFTAMTFSTDAFGSSVYPGQELPFLGGQRFSFSDESKVFFQVENEGKAFYNFFDIKQGATSFEIDPALCTSPSLAKTITFPGQGKIQASGRKDKTYKESYFFGQKKISGGSGVYFYPAEVFEEYYTLITYNLNGIVYADSFKGAVIAQTASPMNLTFEPNGLGLSTFRPTFIGKFDYYQAQFGSGNLTMDLHVPSTAVSAGLVYPDFAAFAGFSDFSTTALTLKHMEAFQYEGFAEDKLSYKNWHLYELNGKAMSKSY